MIDENSNLSKLPEGWLWTRLGEVCLDPQYGWTTSAVVKGSLHLLRTTDITAGDIHWDSVPFCKQEPPEKQKYLIKDGDIVISRAGSVGYSHLIRIPKEAVFASYLIRFRPLVDEACLAYFLKSPSYWESISEKSLGIAIPNVNASKLKQVVVPLPPLPEQHRIVAKIEELFTKLDAGVEGLKKVKAQLSRYRQAVLKYAFEGKLTKEWREAHKGQMESASVLLERIKEERRRSIEGKFKELPYLDTSNMSELPEGWVWTRLGEILSVVKGKKPEKLGAKDEFLTIPYVNIKAFEKKVFSQFTDGNGCTFCEPDDVLIVWDGARCGLVGRGVAGAIGSTLANLVRYELNSAYLFHFLQTKYEYINSRPRGVGIPHVEPGIFWDIDFPLPPLPEQRRIVEEIERHFSVANAIEKNVEQSLKRAERLRQSILKRAFEGKLVPQDPTDESAENLLERIRTERARIEVKKKATGKTRRN